MRDTKDGVVTSSEPDDERGVRVAAAPILDPRHIAAVRVTLDWAQQEFPAQPREWSHSLAACALAHCACLLEGEMLLLENQLWHLAAVLGRTLKETWLYGQYFLLEPEEALAMLDGEHQHHMRRRHAGRVRLRDLEHLFPGVRSDREPGDEHPSTTQPNLADLALKVEAARERDDGWSEASPGLARVIYDLHYRSESADSVHPGYFVFGRYLGSVDGTRTVEREPGMYLDVETTDHPPQRAIQGDAFLVADLLGLYLAKIGRRGEMAEFERRIEEAMNASP